MQIGAQKNDEPQQIVDAWNVKLSMLDIEKGIRELDAKSSAGPDNGSPIVVKKCADAFVWPLWILHEKSMESGKIASTLKVSRVVPVYKKKGTKVDITNYRITAISSVFMRIYESAMQVKLISHVDPQLTNSQHGFRPNRSITTNLLNLSVLAHDAMSVVDYSNEAV